MAWKWWELASFYLHATATAPLFFALAPPRRAPPFSVHASGAVALKVAQVPSTDSRYSTNYANNSLKHLYVKRDMQYIRCETGDM